MLLQIERESPLTFEFLVHHEFLKESFCFVWKSCRCLLETVRGIRTDQFQYTYQIHVISIRQYQIHLFCTITSVLQSHPVPTPCLLVASQKTAGSLGHCKGTDSPRVCLKCISTVNSELEKNNNVSSLRKVSKKRGSPIPFRASVTASTMCSSVQPSSAKAPASWRGQLVCPLSKLFF